MYTYLCLSAYQSIIQLKVIYWGIRERHVGGLKAEAFHGLQSPETMLCVSVNMIYKASTEHQKWILMAISMYIFRNLPVIFKAETMALWTPEFLQRAPSWLVIPSSSWILETPECLTGYLKGISGLFSHVILWLFSLGISCKIQVENVSSFIPVKYSIARNFVTEKVCDRWDREALSRSSKEAYNWASPVNKNPSASTGDTGLILGPGRSHMPQNN